MCEMRKWRRFARVFMCDWAVAQRNVLRQWRHTIIGLSAVSAGVVSLILAAGFFEWNYEAIREWTIRARTGHIQIVRTGFTEHGTGDLFSYLLPPDQVLRQSVERLDGVTTVAPRLQFSGLISKGEVTASFLGEGVDPEREEQLSTALLIRDGSDLDSRNPFSVLVGEGLARSVDLNVGETIVLLSNTASGGVNAVEVRVAGIFSTSIKAYDDYAIRLPLAAAQELLRVSGVHMWLVLLARTGDTERVATQLSQRFRGSELEVVPWHQTAIADFYKKTVALFSKQVWVIKVLIAAIVVLSILNTMTSSIMERVTEIGTRLAMGERRRMLLRRFLTEGVILGLVGGLFGVVLGIALATLITWIGIPMPAPPGMARGYTGGILITPAIILDALLLAILTAFLAGLYPALKASNLQIVDSIRHNR